MISKTIKVLSLSLILSISQLSLAYAETAVVDTPLYNSAGEVDLRLTREEDKAYDEIHNGILNLNDSISLNHLKISINDIRDIYYKVIHDNPRIFYSSGFSYTYNKGTGIVSSVIPKYSYDKNTIRERLVEIDSKVDDILEKVIESDMTEFEKERAIHDYIVLNTAYDEVNLKANTVPKDSYNVYGTLIKGVAVCQGYSESMKLLLDKVGIESIIVSSPPMNHAWNIVTIANKKYHVDVTWNDPVPDRLGKISYKFFNVSDTQMKKSHTWDYGSYPKCTSDAYSRFWKIDSPKTLEDDLFYINNESNREFIYKLNLDTLKQSQITTVRTAYFDISGEWIYFSNYSNGGYLYKVKLDGTRLTKLNNTHSIDIYKRDNYIYYTEQATKTVKKLKVEDKREVEDDYTGYKKWPEKTDTPLDKTWKVKFNYSLDEKSVSDKSVFVTDRYGRVYKNISLNLSDEGETVTIKPTRNYESNSVYFLHVRDVVSSSGRLIKENIKMKFSTKNKEKT